MCSQQYMKNPKASIYFYNKGQFKYEGISAVLWFMHDAYLIKDCIHSVVVPCTQDRKVHALSHHFCQHPEAPVSAVRNVFLFFYLLLVCSSNVFLRHI